jgi:hypothetical protein
MARKRAEAPQDEDDDENNKNKKKKSNNNNSNSNNNNNNNPEYRNLKMTEVFRKQYEIGWLVMTGLQIFRSLQSNTLPS